MSMEIVLKKYNDEDGVKDLIIPDSVTEIGSLAFKGCEKLESITIPQSVAKINRYAFYGCSDKVKIYSYAPIRIWKEPEFKEKIIIDFVTGLEKGISFPKDVVTAYKKYIKMQRKRLYDAALSNKILLIFMMKEKIIPITDIDHLLQNTSNAEINALILEYGKNNFTDDDREKQLMREFNVNPFSAAEMKKKWNYEKKEDGTLVITGYKGEMTDVVVPSEIGKAKVTEIGEDAFSPEKKGIRNAVYNARINVKSVVIPETVTKIGNGAFRNCMRLESVRIPVNNIKSVGSNAFLMCSRLFKNEIDDLFKNTPEKGINISLCCCPFTVVYMGSYKGSRIRWYVLDRKNDESILITVSSIETLAFDETGLKALWENCTLRNWLNNDFYENVFSEDEKENIVLSHNSNLGFGKDTNDKVYILSKNETYKYFSSDYERADFFSKPWWIRSNGREYGFSTAYIDFRGGRNSYGAKNQDPSVGVRPVIKVNAKFIDGNLEKFTNVNF